VPVDQLLEIDRYALAMTTQFQAEVLASYEKYEFHPVVARLQTFCSEDLGAFYLDILKDRLYTTGADSRARRSAQTALWHITTSLLRLMAPFLSLHRRRGLCDLQSQSRNCRTSDDLRRDVPRAAGRGGS
jgi:isoleucyl-tRNA synthetase